MFLLQGLWQAGTGRAYSLLKTFIGLTVYLRSTWGLQPTLDLHGAYILLKTFMGLTAYSASSWGLKLTVDLHGAYSLLHTFMRLTCLHFVICKSLLA